MRVKHFILACLVVAAMAAGLIARDRIDSRDPYAYILRNRDLSRQLSAYASGGAASDAGGRSDVDLRPVEVMYSALQHLRDDYVEPIESAQERDLTYGALKVMLDSLHDPFTRFLDPDQAQLAQEAGTGKFHGIGAVISVRQDKQDGMTEERLVVVDSLPGSPAREAGLKTGDLISEIDGKTVLPYDPFQRVEKLIKQVRNGQVNREKLPKILEAENERIKNGVGFQKAMDMLSSKASKDVTLVVSRAGSKTPLKIKVAARQTVVDPVAHAMLNPTVGYIKVNLIVKDAETQFAEAITDLKSRGAKGLVVDLRDCPGGAIESAQSIAGNLIPKKTLALLQMTKGKQKTLKAGDPGTESGAWAGPVAVLVNGGTASVSEVLAVALRDGAAAKLVGAKTFGTNLQQTFLPLRDGSAVTLTTGKYLSAKGLDYRGKGLAVDVPAPAGSKPDDDPQLAKAIASLAPGKVKG